MLNNYDREFMVNTLLKLLFFIAGAGGIWAFYVSIELTDALHKIEFQHEILIDLISKLTK